MATDNKQFLRFSAYSMKDYLTRKLTATTKYTDQVYEGSNIAILIDLCAYMYQCLVYQLNSAASEAMFADTQVYENINRLVKMLGYSPKGIIPSEGTFYLDNSQEILDANFTGSIEGGKYAGKVIPKYSYIETGLVDKRGKQICFSTTKDEQVNSEQNYSFQMVNGKWARYPRTFTASGSDFETFILEDIKSSIDDEEFAANGMVHVYVKDSIGTITQWESTEYEIFLENDINDDSYGKVIDGEKKIYNLRLNEYKQYEIKFGNGTIGKKLNNGDVVYVFYLECNGLEGQLSPDSLPTGTKLKHSASGLNIDVDTYNSIFNNYGNWIQDSVEPPDVFLLDVTSTPNKEEDVDAIRNAAPEQFKMGRRLVTKDDYEYYVKNAFLGQVIDVKCQSNYEYVAQSFYLWLYNLGVNNHNDPSYYINEVDLVKYGFKYSDPADSNNVYLWTKLYKQTVANFQPRLLNRLQNLKALTHEVVQLEPIDVNFALCAAPTSAVTAYFKQTSFDSNIENWLEVIINSNYLYASNSLQSQIANIIRQFFDPVKQKLGQQVDVNSLLADILSINGVQNVRTVYQATSADSTTYVPPVIKPGICFASWSASYIEAGDDLEVTNSTRKLEDFQFPVLNENNIENHIKIIKSSMTNLNTNIQY